MPSLPGLCVNRQDSAGVFRFWLMRSIAVWQSDRFVIISGSHSRNERCMQLETSKKNSNHGVKATKVKTSKRNAPIIHTIHMCMYMFHSAVNDLKRTGWILSIRWVSLTTSSYPCWSQSQSHWKPRCSARLGRLSRVWQGMGEPGRTPKKKSSNHPKLSTFALLEYRYDSYGTMLIWMDFIGWKWNDGFRMERPCKWYSSQGQHQPVKAQLLQCVLQALLPPREDILHCASTARPIDFIAKECESWLLRLDVYQSSSGRWGNVPFLAMKHDESGAGWGTLPRRQESANLLRWMPFTTKVPTFDAAAKTRNVQGMSSMSCSTKTDFGFDPFKQYKTV